MKRKSYVSLTQPGIRKVFTISKTIIQAAPPSTNSHQKKVQIHR